MNINNKDISVQMKGQVEGLKEVKSSKSKSSLFKIAKSVSKVFMATLNFAIGIAVAIASPEPMSKGVAILGTVALGGKLAKSCKGFIAEIKNFGTYTASRPFSVVGEDHKAEQIVVTQG
jgi:hypothetical protein